MSTKDPPVSAFVVLRLHMHCALAFYMGVGIKLTLVQQALYCLSRLPSPISYFFQLHNQSYVLAAVA